MNPVALVGKVPCHSCVTFRRTLRHLRRLPGRARGQLYGAHKLSLAGLSLSPDTSARSGVGYASAILPIRHLRLAFRASKDRHLKLALLSRCDPTFPSLLPPTEEDGNDVAVISPRHNAVALHLCIVIDHAIIFSRWPTLIEGYRPALTSHSIVLRPHNGRLTMLCSSVFSPPELEDGTLSHSCSPVTAPS